MKGKKRAEVVTTVDQHVAKIRKADMSRALKRMKSGKTFGPDDILVEPWKCLGEVAVEFLSEKIQSNGGEVSLCHFFRNKGDVQSCDNYRGI